MIDLEAIRKRNKELREDNWFPLSAISDWDWSPSPCDDIDALIAEVERLEALADTKTLLTFGDSDNAVVLGAGQEVDLTIDTLNQITTITVKNLGFFIYQTAICAQGSMTVRISNVERIR